MLCLFLVAILISLKEGRIYRMLQVDPTLQPLSIYPHRSSTRLLLLLSSLLTSKLNTPREEGLSPTHSHYCLPQSQGNESLSCLDPAHLPVLFNPSTVHLFLCSLALQTNARLPEGRARFSLLIPLPQPTHVHRAGHHAFNKCLLCTYNV